MEGFIEQRIVAGVRGLLEGRVNEVLGEWEFVVPVIEFGKIGGVYAVSPDITLWGCEKTEKERVLRTEVYSLSVSFTLQEHEDGELFCYAYAAAFEKALGKDVTLGGVAGRAVITGKKYVPPKKTGGGEGWGVVISVRVNV